MKIFTLLITLLYITTASGQNSLEDLLKKYNTHSIPYISVSELQKIKDTVVVLDAREEKEYQISHLQNAIPVGYTNFKIDSVLKQNIPKDSTIVVYCSLGIRSENVSEKLKKAGYTKVYNLYGGIFEWKNQNYPVINPNNEVTEEVHAYSKEWSIWLHKGIKIYTN